MRGRRLYASFTWNDERLVRAAGNETTAHDYGLDVTHTRAPRRTLTLDAAPTAKRRLTTSTLSTNCNCSARFPRYRSARSGGEEDRSLTARTHWTRWCATRNATANQIRLLLLMPDPSLAVRTKSQSRDGSCWAEDISYIFPDFSRFSGASPFESQMCAWRGRELK